MALEPPADNVPPINVMNDVHRGIEPRSFNIDQVVASERIMNQNGTNRSDLEKNNDSQFHQFDEKRNQRWLTSTHSFSPRIEATEDKPNATSSTSQQQQ